jgi:hypothetical protein
MEEAMSSSVLEIDFYNQSGVQWIPDKNDNQHLVPGTNPIVSWPNAPLIAMTGYAACKVNQDMSKLGAGSSGSENYMFFCWNDGHWRFGVKILIPLQLFDMGDRPNWQVMSDQNLDSSTINWAQSGSDPGVQYSWPTTVGYSVVATPTSSHNGLSIVVQINNLPKK